MPLKVEQTKKIDKEIRELRKQLADEAPEVRNTIAEKMAYGLQYGVLAIIELLEGGPCSPREKNKKGG